ncbi:hypothetical protein [Methylobacterium nodulans]|uniref:Transmembrane protein n=1 Tax=Methylobacterium nodulans (strain LMG 21967 / CNCM I-2342 / ORS 2060) TaxID=460265 RepID=B8IM05_METNO|nr:hypothetical protein [Methylobacterium nodulans]ACL56349.1 conserved hypothetical protein [Methylobacterium nodulans ORS 2060]
MSEASASLTRRDWPTLFLRAVLSLFLGLPLGGVLYALGGVATAWYAQDPILQHPWILTFRSLGTVVGYVFLGGFAWSPEAGYESLHGWYAAGVLLAFVLLSRPWRRRPAAAEPWPRAS